MISRPFTKLLFAVFLFAIAPVAVAQTSNDETNVWSTVEQQWRAERQGDLEWVETLLSGDFVGWPLSSPAPRNKTSTRLWNEFDTKQSELLQFELYPQSIVVHGDMAVVHYLYSSASKPRGGDIVRNTGRYTDVLVRDGEQWKFIAWHGGNDR